MMPVQCSVSSDEVRDRFGFYPFAGTQRAILETFSWCIISIIGEIRSCLVMPPEVLRVQCGISLVTSRNISGFCKKSA